MAEAETLDRPEEASPVAPFEVSDELRPRIDELELWDVVASLREHGYGVIRDAGPPSLWDELREGIHGLSTPTDTASANGIVGSAPLLLGRHPAVDRVATLPKVMAIAEFSCGKAMRAGRFVGSIKHQFKGEGDGALGLHADQNWMPVPFPEHNLVMTFCFACEGMTRAGGATCVVPGSHRLRRPPTPKDLAGLRPNPGGPQAVRHPPSSDGRRTQADCKHEPRSRKLETVAPVAIETEKGDVAVWDGAVWHGSLPRTIPGTRTVLHATYQRLYTQPIDDFTYLLKDEEYMASAPEGMRQLLGADLFFHTATPERDVDMQKFMYAAAAAKT